MDAHDAGQLKFFNTYAGLADKSTFKRFHCPAAAHRGVAHCKAPFAGPEQVLRYLSRYTHRVAIQMQTYRKRVPARVSALSSPVGNWRPALLRKRSP